MNHLEGAPPAGVPVARFGDLAREPDWHRITAQINAAKLAGKDLVILLALWGFEYEYWPAVTQRAHALRLIALGVDVILGSSPHVLQPVEVVSVDGADPACPLQAKRGGSPRFALIAWSLGTSRRSCRRSPARLERSWRSTSAATRAACPRSRRSARSPP